MIDFKTAGRAVIEGDAVVIRFPMAAMQSALDGAWGLNVFDQRQKVTDEAEFANEFCAALNREDEQGTTMIHRMGDKAFVQMMEVGAFGIDLHEDQSDAFTTAAPSPALPEWSEAMGKHDEVVVDIDRATTRAIGDARKRLSDRFLNYLTDGNVFDAGMWLCPQDEDNARGMCDDLADLALGRTPAVTNGERQP